jgi:type II secretory pathway component PulF
MMPCILSNLATGTLFASGDISVVVIMFAMIFAPGFIVVGGFVTLMAYRKRQLSMQRAFISTLAVAAERKIPLAPTIRACAAERSAWPRRQILLLAEMIESGVPPAEAFERSQGLFPAEAMPVIQAGFQTESLGKALQQFIADDDKDSNLWASLTAKLLWLTLLLAYGAIILMFYTTKIVPAMQKIFIDFGISLPPITQAVIDVSDMADLIFPLAFLLVIFLSTLSLYSLLRYSGWLTINLPGADRILRRYDMATVLESLALAVDRHQPLEPVLATFARFYPKRGIRQRLDWVYADTQQGGDWCGSLTRHKLIKPADEAVLQSAVRASNLNWALRQLAGSQRRRFAYRVQMLSQIVFPPVVILVAMVVSIFVVGCFVPLVHLITALT